jgi:hypothetical protein
LANAVVAASRVAATAVPLRHPIRCVAENFESSRAKSLGISLAILGKLDDERCDPCRHGIRAMDKPELGQRRLVRCRQMRNVLRSKRVVILEC